MKTVKKQVYLKPKETEFKRLVEQCWGDEAYTYTFTSDKYYDINSMEHFIEVGVPETMGEFRELNSVSSKELLEWLNKNYK